VATDNQRQPTIHNSPSTIHSFPFRLLVGLGNPGREYAQTRHNVGFMVLDKLAARDGARFRHEAKWNAEIASCGSVLLCKPMSFMNLSGEPVSNVSRFYKILPNEMLVVLDDSALPLGRLRLRASGSSGGHNGLQSILDHIGGEKNNVPRLRIGIGAAEGRGMTQHVLGRFAPEETPLLEQSLARAVEAIDFAQAQGLEAAMNKFNSQPSPSSESSSSS
jgi:PTH1 family peptidyl-tRNA hydrolase